VKSFNQLAPTAMSKKNFPTDYRKPSKAEILAAAGKFVPDLIAPRLKVLFCGINPGLYSGATGHHFARPGNRFWTTLYAAGFTAHLLHPSEERELLRSGYGITNLVERATATAAELSNAELIEGQARLIRKGRRFKPKFLAVLGVGAYRVGFGQPKAILGRQSEMIGGTTVWVLPNPSGLNANYQLKDLTELFSELRAAAEKGKKQEGESRK
jgi:TDG/mug DNA glycosylase family protein